MPESIEEAKELPLYKEFDRVLIVEEENLEKIENAEFETFIKNNSRESISIEKGD